MSVDIKCEQEFIVSYDSRYESINITYKDTTIKLHKRTDEIEKLNFEVYLYDSSNTEFPEASCITIDLRTQHIVFTFSYELRYIAMKCYDNLRDMVKKMY